MEQSTLEKLVAKFPSSQRAYEKAHQCFSRGTTHDTYWFRPFPLFFARAEGSRKWDLDGNELIDNVLGNTALLLGNAHPSIVQAVSEQVTKGTHYGGSHLLMLEWADLIKQLFPSIELLEFTASATEAVMMGIRLARAFTGREKIVKFEEHFFGWYDATLTGLAEPWDQPVSGGLVPALMEKTITIPCNDGIALEKVLSRDDVAALIVEAPGAHTGSLCIEPDFYPFMEQCAKRHGTLLLFDETISAFRFTPGGVQSWRGVEADLTVLGKSLSCGVGGGVVGGRRDVMDMLDIRPDDPEWQRHKRVFHCGSWNAPALQSAAGVAALSMYASGEPQKTADQAAGRIRKGFNQVMQKMGVEGCCFGQFSTFHLYLGPCAQRAECDMHLCFNTGKTPSLETSQSLLMNFWLNGVHMIGRAELFGSTSSVHTEQDADQTIDAFGAALERLIAEGTLDRMPRP